MKPSPLNKPLLFMILLALCNPIAGNSERDEKAYIVQTDRGLFVGQIDKGQLHGHGILFLKNGDYFIGTWTRGSLEGPGAWYERLPSSDSLHFSYHFVIFANNRVCVLLFRRHTDGVERLSLHCRQLYIGPGYAIQRHASVGIFDQSSAAWLRCLDRWHEQYSCRHL